MRRKFLRLPIFIILVLSAALVASGQTKEPVKGIAEHVNALLNSSSSLSKISLLSIDAGRIPQTQAAVKNAVPVTLDFVKLNNFISTSNEMIEFSFPYDNKDLVIQLYKVNLFADDFIVVTDQSNGEAVPYTPGLYYRGILKGDPNSLAAFSFFDGEIVGMVSNEKYQNIILGKSGFPGAKSSDYIIYSDKEIYNPSGFSCATYDDPAYVEKLKEYASGGSVRTAKCVRMYYEVDNNIYTSSGSNITNTTNWMTAVHNNVATLYSNDAVSTALSEIFIWSTQDPFTGSSSSSRLSSFKSVRTSFNGDVAQLVAIDPGGLGGVASTINGMCSSSNKYCYSDVDYFYNNVPTYSWTIMVLTHEFGHLLGSYHTHNCGWPIGALDNCYETEGFCSKGPAPVGGGTIMSYCHLTSYGINFTKGFGPYPAAAIQGAVDAAPCLQSTCMGTCITPGGLNTTSITSSSATLNWSLVSGSLSYNVQYRPTGSSTWTTTTSTTNSKAISGLSAATQYEFQVQAECSSGQSAFSASSTFTTPSPACVDNYEPNNAKTKAKAIALNTNVFALINTSTDKDWFSFANSAGSSNIMVTLSTLPGDYDLELYNTNGNKVVSSENANTENEEIIFNTSTVGTYKVRVFGAGGSFNSTQCYTLFVTTSSTPFRLSETIASSSAVIYPNPNNGVMDVKYSSAADAIINLNIYDLAGKLLSQDQLQATAGSNQYHLDLKGLVSGVYIAEIRNGSDVTRTRFVVEK